MNIIMARYKLNVSKANAICESAISRYNIENFETICNATQGYFTEADESANSEKHKKLIDSIKEFFDRLIKALKDAIADIKRKFNRAVAQHNLNKRLKMIAAMYATDKTLETNGKVKMFDFRRYYTNFKKVALTITNEYSRICYKKYNSYEEFEKAMDKFDDFCEDVYRRYGISEEDQFYWLDDINEAIDMEVDFIKLTDEALDELDKLAENEENDMMNLMNTVADEINEAMDRLSSGSPLNDKDSKDLSEEVKIKNGILAKTRNFASSFSNKISQGLTKMNMKVLENFNHIDKAAKIPETAENA